MYAPAEKTTNQPKPGMVDTKLQMAVCFWDMGLKITISALKLLETFFHIYNKYYFDKKK